MPFPLFAAIPGAEHALEAAGVPASGLFDELLDDVDIMLDAAPGGIGPKNKIKYLEHGSGSCSKVGSRARWPMCSSTAPPTTSNDSLVHGEESFCLVIDTHACR